MTLQRYTDTFLASHYSDIHVSIPPDQDFGSLRKAQSAMMVAVEVDDMSQMSSQLFKGLI